MILDVLTDRVQRSSSSLAKFYPSVVNWLRFRKKSKTLNVDLQTNDSNGALKYKNTSTPVQRVIDQSKSDTIHSFSLNRSNYLHFASVPLLDKGVQLPLDLSLHKLRNQDGKSSFKNKFNLDDKK